jgi:hypothetical protein
MTFSPNVTYKQHLLQKSIAPISAYHRQERHWTDTGNVAGRRLYALKFSDIWFVVFIPYAQMWHTPPLSLVTVDFTGFSSHHAFRNSKTSVCPISSVPYPLLQQEQNINKNKQELTSPLSQGSRNRKNKSRFELSTVVPMYQLHLSRIILVLAVRKFQCK